ncbi:MAG: hypothetical protein KJ792_14620 [Actinobacteria bacterium]|nr:hypothetical protein [Actinomycetota bacterium]
MSDTDQFDRSARFWLRAYPVRWRSVRGDELLGVLRDLAGPEATRLSLREGLGLLRSGWVTRWRDGPPLRTRLAYRLFDRRVPVAHREWVRDDIAGRWFLTRRMMRTLLIWAGIFVPWMASVDPHRLMPFAVIWVPALALGVVLDVAPPANDRVRTVAAAKHLLPRPGERAVPGGFTAGLAARIRISARTGTLLLVATLGFGAAIWVPATMLASSLPVPRTCPTSAACLSFGSQSWPEGLRLLTLGTALGVGVLAASVAAGRFARILPARPAQPSRLVVGHLGRQYAALLIVGPLLVWQARGETLPAQTAVIAPLGAVLTLVLLPGAVTAWRATRPGPADLALVDLWRVGLLGRVPQIDDPVTGVVRRPVATRPGRP